MSFSRFQAGKELEASLRNEARWWFHGAAHGEYNWARGAVYRFVRVKNLSEI